MGWILYETQPTEYYQYHPMRTNPDFCKTYSNWKRIVHHSVFLACLFAICDSSTSLSNTR